MKQPLRHHILPCGEVVSDLFPEGPRFGGAPANFACHAARLGAEVSLISAVGDDARGREAVRIPEGFGVGTGLIEKTKGAPTGSDRVSLDAAGEPACGITAGAARDTMAWDAAFESGMAGVDAVSFGTLELRGAVSRETVFRLLEMARTRRLLRVLDVKLRRPFFDAALIRQAMACASVCFPAGLVTGLLRGDSLTAIARSARKTASAVCAQNGALPLLVPCLAKNDPPPDHSLHETVPAPVCC